MFAPWAFGIPLACAKVMSAAKIDRTLCVEIPVWFNISILQKSGIFAPPDIGCALDSIEICLLVFSRSRL